MADEKGTVTVEEAGRRCGFSRASAYEAVRRGELPVLRFGRRLVVPVVQLERLLAGEMNDKQAVEA